MAMSVEREKVRFASGDTECAAWHYPGSNGACIVMAGGFAVTKEPGTDLFARRFHEAGFAVLAFDYRRLGESGGLPRQVVRIGEQLADWRAAIGFAATLPGVDPARIALWGFSASGGHVFRVAARNPGLAAAIAQTPNADGPTAARNAARHQKPLAMLRFTGRCALDAIGGLAGRRHGWWRWPVSRGPWPSSPRRTPWTAAVRSTRTTGTRTGCRRWLRARRSASGCTGPAAMRPGCGARCWSLVCDQDQSALAGPAVGAARRAPRVELVRLAGGHYAPFLDGHEQAVEFELSFLRRHLLDRVRAEHPAAAASVPHLGGRS